MRTTREAEEYWVVVHFENEIVLEVIGPFIAEGGATWYAENRSQGAPDGHRWHIMEMTEP